MKSLYYDSPEPSLEPPEPFAELNGGEVLRCACCGFPIEPGEHTYRDWITGNVYCSDCRRGRGRIVS